MDESASFGTWLKRRRATLHLTQEEVARQVDCALGTLRKLETDERRPSVEIAERLAVALRLPPEQRTTFVKVARAQLAVDHLGTPSNPTQSPDHLWLSRTPTNLPVLRNDFVGREEELMRIPALLQRDDIGLVTLSGVGGTGKTRLALQVADSLLENFPDGVWFVDLAPISDPALVPAKIAATLDLKEVNGTPLLEMLTAYLQEKQVLLVLDNFEQVVEAASVVATLLNAAARLKLLVTSRVVLHLTGEQEYPVPPLAVPEPVTPGKTLPSLERLTQYAAIELFIQRAQRVNPDFAVTNANALAVAEICHRLDGLPLAIVLAAARSKLFPPAALLRRLEQRLEVLRSSARDVPLRHQTLRNAIAWSYDLLDHEEQRLFRRLGVFVSGCTIEAVEAVCAEGDLGVDVPDQLVTLVDKSLVQQIEASAAEPRFVMLETIREYALEQLAACGEAEAVRRQHASYYLALAEYLQSPEQVMLARQLETVHDNLRAALNWALTRGEVEMALRFGVALSGFWWRAGYISEGRRWLEAALVQVVSSQDTEPRVRMQALVQAAWLATRQGDFARATPLAEEALAWFRTRGDNDRIIETLQILAWIASIQGEHAVVRALDDETLALMHDPAERRRHKGKLNNIALRAAQAGNNEQVIPLLEECLALCREENDTDMLCNVLSSLGDVLLERGDHGRAQALLTEGIQIARQLGHKEALIGYLDSYAWLYTLLSARQDPQAPDLWRAICLFAASAALSESIGAPFTPHEAAAHAQLVATARAQIDEETFAAVWAEGQVMTLEQAIAYALEEPSA